MRLYFVPYPIRSKRSITDMEAPLQVFHITMYNFLSYYRYRMKDGKVVWKKIQSLQEVSTGVLLNIFGSKCIWFLFNLIHPANPMRDCSIRHPQRRHLFSYFHNLIFSSETTSPN